jgi:hypothetical protein
MSVILASPITVMFHRGVISERVHLGITHPDQVQQIRQRYLANPDNRSDRKSIPRLSGDLLCVPYQTSRVPDIACTQGTALQRVGIASEPSVSLSDSLGMERCYWLAGW